MTMLDALRREQQRIRRDLVAADRIETLQATARAQPRATNFNQVGWEAERERRAHPRPRFNRGEAGVRE